MGSTKPRASVLQFNQGLNQAKSLQPTAQPRAQPKGSTNKLQRMISNFQIFVFQKDWFFGSSLLFIISSENAITMALLQSLFQRPLLVFLFLLLLSSSSSPFFQKSTRFTALALSMNLQSHPSVSASTAASPHNNRHGLLPEHSKLLIGYATECGPKVTQAIREGGVNVVIWSFLDIRRQTDDDKHNIQNTTSAISPIELHTNSLNLSDIANLKASLGPDYDHVRHLTAFGGWNGPHVDTSISAAEWWTFWKDHLGQVFDGIDWDPEGHDDLSQATNTLSLDCLNRMGEISQLAHADGYIVSLAPAQSYMDLDMTKFSRSLSCPGPPEWHPEFHHFGANGYAYLLARFGHAPWDFVSIQFYESYSRAAREIDDVQDPSKTPVANYLVSYMRRHAARGETWKVNFADDPSVQLANQHVSLPLSKIVWGFANGWAFNDDFDDKVVYMDPSEIQQAYTRLQQENVDNMNVDDDNDDSQQQQQQQQMNDDKTTIDCTPRGFMFWVIGEEGTNGISLAPALHRILTTNNTTIGSSVNESSPGEMNGTSLALLVSLFGTWTIGQLLAQTRYTSMDRPDRFNQEGNSGSVFLHPGGSLLRPPPSLLKSNTGTMQSRCLAVGCFLLVISSLCHLVRGQECADGQSQNGECLWTDSTYDASSTCTLYLAESSIPGAGLGIFTAIDKEEGDIVGNGDVIIPVIDFLWHMSADYRFDASYHFDPLANYVWDGREFGLQFETAMVQVGISAMAPGLDCAINCHLGLINVDKTEPVYDDANLHRSKDPGAGAFSPYHNSSTIVTAPIPAGGEIFKSYGNDYFLSRKSLELVPVWEDYPQAEEFVNIFNKFWDDKLAHLPFDTISDLWSLIYNLPLKSRLFNALPKDMNEFESVMLDGIRAILQPHFTRDLDLLRKHGRCVDNIKSGPSTLSQAGHGAFASRPLAKGEIVTGSPLLWYPNKDYFRMYSGNWTSQTDPPDVTNQTNSQIIMNYCWTHRDASLFLCPYGPGVPYINHNKQQANIRVEWAKDGEMGHKEHLLNEHPEAMFPKASPGLTLEFIATRDIAEGEELFLDYGEEWEAAWREHEASWERKSKEGSFEHYQSARMWNHENPGAILRTVEEQATNPYPSNFEFRCLKEIGAFDLTPEEATNLWSEIRTVGLPCSVQNRSLENGHMYIVHFLPDEAYESGLQEYGLTPDEDGQLWWMETDWIVREAIKIVDAPYSSDLQMKEAFRHPISIPDEIFPDAWSGYKTVGLW